MARDPNNSWTVAHHNIAVRTINIYDYSTN